VFTTGRLVFVAIFVTVFLLVLIWSYRKEASLNKVHFQKVYRVLLTILLVFLALFLIVRLRRYF
jgi:hypothetical protein